MKGLDEGGEGTQGFFTRKGRRVLREREEDRRKEINRGDKYSLGKR